MGLHRPSAQNQLPVKAHVSAWNPLSCCLNSAGQIGFRIRKRGTHGQLTAGENHRFFLPQQHIAEGSGGVAHGIRAVGYHHAIAVLHGLIAGVGKLCPFLRLNVAGIHGEHVPTDNLRIAADVDLPQQFSCIQCRGQSLRRFPAGNGSSRSQQSQLLHGTPST